LYGPDQRLSQCTQSGLAVPVRRVDTIRAMPRWTARAVAPIPAGDASIDNLIARAADLKGELVAFAQRPRFARRLDALLVDAADDHGHLDEVVAVATIDRFALQQRLSPATCCRE
jgi:hypothetical protein